MTTNTTDRQLLWIVLAVVAALVVLPAFGMGFGMMGTGPMMDGMWADSMWGADGASGWMLAIGAGMHLLALAVIVGAVSLGFRAVTGQGGSADPALEELRAAYARGDLSDDEYEHRRERLETEP